MGFWGKKKNLPEDHKDDFSNLEDATDKHLEAIEASKESSKETKKRANKVINLMGVTLEMLNKELEKIGER